MSIKKLRQKKNLSQEELAETTGLSLRTIQRVESGDSVSTTSWKTLASFFGMSVDALQEYNQVMDLSAQQGLNQQRLAHHRSAQLIIFIVVFFVAVSQWLAYYASLTPGNSSANLWTILSYISQIAIAAAVFAYLFSHAKITFVWSYYATTAAFFCRGNRHRYLDRALHRYGVLPAALPGLLHPVPAGATADSRVADGPVPER